MKSTPTEALENELNIASIDLRLEGLEQMEAKKLKKICKYIKLNITKTTNGQNSSCISQRRIN